MFRRSTELPAVAAEAVAVGAHTFWAQLGLHNDEAVEIAWRGGLSVVMDRCLKIEHARFAGGLHLAGFDTGVISAKRAVPSRTALSHPTAGHLVEIVGQVLREVGGIVSGAVNEAGLAAPENSSTHEIQTRCRGHTAVVAHKTFGVKDWNVEPRVIGAKACCPHHRLDLTRTEREQQRRICRDPSRIESLWVVQLLIERAPGRPTCRACRAADSA